MSVVLLALLDYAATAIDSEALADWVGETAREAIEAAGATTLLAYGCWAIVGSANLTEHALNANLEAGVLVVGDALASALGQHGRSLMHSGIPVRALPERGKTRG